VSSHHATRRGFDGTTAAGQAAPIAATASPRSSTVRARKPARGRTACRPGSVSNPPPSPSAAVRGMIAAMPHAFAGCRRLPARSLPIPSGTTPAATRAASPPLEPPGPRVASSGCRVRPHTGLSVSWRYIACGTLALPITTAPAARTRRTISASSPSTRPRRLRIPSVVASPHTAKHSFTLTGTPARGPTPDALFAIVSSIAVASASASRRRSCTSPLSRDAHSSCSRSDAASTSAASTRPAATCRAMSAAEAGGSGDGSTDGLTGPAD
jgi:hypothetical protein